MAQGIFAHLNNTQLKEITNINFNTGNGQPSLSGDTLTIYQSFNNIQLQGVLDLVPFPNLRKILFQYDIYYKNLDNIDISKNEKLCKITVAASGSASPFNYFVNNTFSLQVKEMQINRIIVFYSQYYTNAWYYTGKFLREQALIPYFLVEDKKPEQLEAEIANLKQSLTQKDQTIADLNKKFQQTPTLSQFQELNNIALPCTELNFNNLKQEIKRLKLKDFNPYFREQKYNFEQLTITAKNKAGDNLKAILDLFLETNKQIIESENVSNNSFAQGQLQGQLITCQTLLKTKFTQEELQDLLNKQKDLSNVEKQSAILQ
ncbi:3262_t:CDS:1, partial [Scutellospora calospora]